LTARQRTAYDKKFGDESGFQVRDNKLYYNPNENINLEVIKPINRVEKIQEIYDDIQRGLGVGLGSFYHQITLSYLNIPKQMTDSFLKKQGDYIVGRVPHKLVNKPITSKVCNERWGIDLIDMEAYYNPRVNGQNKYILTAVDYFSGRVFARPLLNRNNNNANPTLSNALNDICVNEAHTFPHIIQGDSEFAKGALLLWCQNNRITLIKTTSYTPNSNGKIERINREVRKKIKAGFVRNNNLSWSANLQDYIKNINNQQNSRNKLSPNQLWMEGYNPHPDNHQVVDNPRLNDNMNIQDRQDYNETKILSRAKKLVSLGKTPVFNVGDFVRIKLLVLNNDMRKARELNMGWNKIAVHYTPQIYQIVQAFHHPRNFVRRDEYTLRNVSCGRIIMSGNPQLPGALPKKFFANDLIKTPIENVETHI